MSIGWAKTRTLLGYLLGYIGKMESNVKIGKQLQLCRENLRPPKSVAKAAEDLHITRGYLFKLENDEGQPSYDLLLKMADYYDTSLDFIFGRREKTLSQGGKEVLKQMENMTDRTQSQFIAIARAMREEDEKWLGYGFGVDAVENLLGESFAEALKQKLLLLTARLGNTSAALAALRSSILSDEFPDNGTE